jgi:Protein of unknown function (DUF1566)/Caspase domain
MTFPKSIKIIAAALCVILWSSLANEGLSALDPAGTNHALIIGINNYKGWPKLESPVRDAEELSKILLEQYNFKKANVNLLTDKTKEKPTLVNILTYMDRYINELGENDNLFIFFSGNSFEDDEGETYWIPIDGKKRSKMTWLRHADLAGEVFASPDFKVKSLIIVTDSAFSNKLIKPSSISLSPFDLRYPEKIQEKALDKSREVLAFGDQHWPGSKQTDGLGLFAYYFRKALMENELDVIDIENLLFDENVIFPITKIAGTKLIRGRIRTPMDQDGQFIVAKVAPSPIVDVVSTGVTPEKGYPGDSFTVKAVTSGPAYEVYVDIAGKRYQMKGQGTEWAYKQKIDKLGTTKFSVAAINEKDAAGKRLKGSIKIIKPKAAVSNVTDFSVDPKTGTGGDSFRFTAKTDEPAKEVALKVKGKAYKMKGSGTSWSLSQAVDEIGTVDFSIVAVNEDGVQGALKDGNIFVKAGVANVVDIKSSPATGYAGEDFTISVKTDRPADGVTVELDGKTYAMEGTGRKWAFKTNIPDIGKKRFTAIAKNIEGVEGSRKSGELLTKKSPLPISDVAAVDVSVVSPGKGYAGDTYSIKVKTTAPADQVVVDIEGAPYPMKGSGKDWSYLAKIDKVGISKYTVTSKNKDGVLGKSVAGEIQATKKPSRPVNVIQASVNPKKGTKDATFKFEAKTDNQAKSVMLVMGGRRYPMTGSGTNWSLGKKIDDTGAVEFSIVALNEDNEDGAAKTAKITVYRDRFKKNKDGTVTDFLTGKTRNRFIDNNNGTITDLVTSLMWMQSPKQIALQWDKAVEYCRTLDYNGLKGWRLPTIGEWNNLRDKKRKNPALPEENPFSNIPTHVGYWSKTKHKFGAKYVYQISMWSGKASHLKKDENAIVWPVRYAEIPD